MRPRTTDHSPRSSGRRRPGRLGATLAAALLPLALGVGLAAGQGPTVVTVGESATLAQRRDLLDLLGLAPDTPLVEVSVAASRAVDALPNEGAGAASAATAFTCLDLGDGTEIATRNVEPVPPSLYALALATAGVGDGRLLVAAAENSPAGAWDAGLAAVAGLVATWERNPCDSDALNPARQRLALDLVARTAAAGEALARGGAPDGLRLAADAVLDTERTIVTDGLTRRSAVDRALAERERARGIALPVRERADLLDLLARVAAGDIAWGTFGRGWTIASGDDRITMRGTGTPARRDRAATTAPEPSPIPPPAPSASAATVSPPDPAMSPPPATTPPTETVPTPMPEAATRPDAVPTAPPTAAATTATPAETGTTSAPPATAPPAGTAVASPSAITTFDDQARIEVTVESGVRATVESRATAAAPTSPPAEPSPTG